MLETVGHRWASGIAPDKANAERDHFYPTPPEGTRALLRVEKFEGTIWEPACGDGAISRELEAVGHTVLSTDLIDRGYGTAGVDFLLDFQTGVNGEEGSLKLSSQRRILRGGIMVRF